MNSRPFETFRDLVDALPPRAVLKLAERQQRMLEEDLALGRTLPDSGTEPVLDFCRFLGGAIHGRLVLPESTLPDHWAFYVRTAKRLMTAEELPREMREDIEAAFQKVVCCIRA